MNRCSRYSPCIVLSFLFLVSPAAAENLTLPQTSSGTSIPRWTVQAGAGSSRAWNLVGFSFDVARSEHVSAYLAAGLGTILVGAGVAYFSTRQGNGVVVSGTAGIVGAHVNAGINFAWPTRDISSVGPVSGPTSFNTRESCLLWDTSIGSEPIIVSGSKQQTQKSPPSLTLATTEVQGTLKPARNVKSYTVLRGSSMQGGY